MHQATTMNERVERSMRLLAAVSLVSTLAAFGCTTNRTAAAPTTTPAENPPMASSAIPIDPTRPSSVDALAVLAADQAYQGRVLGKVNPDGAQSIAPTPPTGVFVNPAVVVNPLTTVNSSVSSAEIGPGITGGKAGGVAVAVMTPATGATMATTGAGATTVAATNSAIPSVSNAAIAAGSNATIANVPSQSASATATPKASTKKVTTSKATTSRKTARATAAVKKPTTATTAQPVRLETNPTGEVVVTNTNPPKQ